MLCANSAGLGVAALQVLVHCQHGGLLHSCDLSSHLVSLCLGQFPLQLCNSGCTLGSLLCKQLTVAGRQLGHPAFHACQQGSTLLVLRAGVACRDCDADSLDMLELTSRTATCGHSMASCNCSRVASMMTGNPTCDSPCADCQTLPMLGCSPSRRAALRGRP